MAIRMTPKLVSAQPAKARAAETRTKPAIAPSPVSCPAISDNSKRPGRPPSGKVRVTMLLRPETVAKFKATGKGWQARMSDALDKAAP